MNKVAMNKVVMNKVVMNRLAPLVLLAGTLFFGTTAFSQEQSVQTLHSLPKPFPAPEFELKGEDGKLCRLSDYRGQVVILNFWATWCPPCREEMPSMERAWQKIKGKGIVILAVNVGEDEDTILHLPGSTR